MAGELRALGDAARSRTTFRTNERREEGKSNRFPKDHMEWKSSVGDSGGTGRIRICGLFIYPVKSCQGIDLGDKVKIGYTSYGDPTGFEHDRNWCIVSTSSAATAEAKAAGVAPPPPRVENQYESHPRLASIKTAISTDVATGETTLTLSTNEMERDLHVKVRSRDSPRDAKRLWTSAFPSERLVQWKKVELPLAEYEGTEATAWLTEYLAAEGRGKRFEGRTFHLVFCPPWQSRELITDDDFAALQRPNERVTFADTSQFLLTSVSSLNALNDDWEDAGGKWERRSDGNYWNKTVMARFRPNIVVSGAPAYDEDWWKLVRIGDRRSYASRRRFLGSDGSKSPPRSNDVDGMMDSEEGMLFRVAMPAMRCAVTTIKQSGPNAGTRDKTRAPMKALGKLRTGKMALCKGPKKRPGLPCKYFGTKLNFVPLRQVESGDPSRVPQQFVFLGDELIVEQRTPVSLSSVSDMDAMSQFLSFEVEGTKKKPASRDLSGCVQGIIICGVALASSALTMHAEEIMAMVGAAA